ncbi:class I glutamine amidotransferase-like protein, partial [Neoconidiobolus thromboides FSU 785]
MTQNKETPDYSSFTLEQKDQFSSTWFKIPMPDKELNVVAVIDNGLDTFDFSIACTMLSFIPKSRIKTIAKTKEPIKTFDGITIIPDHSFDEDIDIDILTLAAGSGPSKELSDYLNRVSDKVNKFFFSVCQGSECLAAAGLLDNKKATITKGLFSISAAKYPNVQWQRQARFVHDGKFITSSGATAGLDGVFYLISKVYDLDTAMKISKCNEYNWVQDPSIDNFTDVEKEFPFPNFSTISQ